jgi:hypothetical protein
VVIASDKTQLTRFSGNKSAYPVYLTIGNLPKSLRRKPSAHACVLIAYLPVEKPDKKGLSKKALKLRNYEIFHRSMALVLDPLKSAGDPKGDGIEMVGGDGVVRRVYPLLCSYVADYPEQCLVTCTKYGTCPKCKRTAGELDLPDPGEPRKQKWTLERIKEAQDIAKNQGKKGSHAHTYAMKHHDVAGGFEPFWAGFPLTDIHKCISPDILHQCYQGVFKHLLGWVQDIVGEDELDQRLQALPKTCGVRHFKNGISGFSQITGTEHKHIARVLLASLVGKVSQKGIIACRSLLHFIHLAQYPSHDQETLGYMDTELKTWQENRSYFIKKGARADFNIPKFHSLVHYVDSIRWLGTTDNYNTETFERYHIDMAKEGWEATNKRDHFPQMTQWLARQEKILSYDSYRNWIETTEDSQAESEDNSSSNLQVLENQEEENTIRLDVAKLRKKTQLQTIPSTSSKSLSNQMLTNIHMAKHPHERQKSLSRIAQSHDAPGFISALKLYMNSQLPKTQQAKKATALQASLPFTSLDVWHQFKFIPINLFDDDSDVPKEIVKAVPSSKKSLVPQYDTVIVLVSNEAESTAVIGCRVARLKVIFQLPETVKRYGIEEPAPLDWPTTPLVYVTWFSHFRSRPDPGLGMYHVKPSVASDGTPQGAIIPLSDIRQSCMLVPSSRTDWDPTWTSGNVLDNCQSFFVNNLQSKYTYQTIY